MLKLYLIFAAFLSGLHRRSVDAGGAEHGSGWRTRAGDSTNSSVHLGSEWNLPGPGRNGGGAGMERKEWDSETKIEGRIPKKTLFTLHQIF